MVRDGNRRGLAALVLVVILSLTVAAPGALSARAGHLTGTGTGAGSLPPSTGATPIPAAVRAAAPHAGSGDGLWIWFERLLSKAFSLPVGPPRTLDAGGCSDPNGSNCG
jgi:hypothetical protein